MNIITNISPLIWNYGPEFFKIGSFSVKWYSLLFALSFVIGRQIGIYIFTREGKNIANVDTILTYMMLGTTLGARLGHVIFYQWDYFSKHPLEILLPFKFEPTFKFTGYSGLASHGAFVGLLLASFLYCFAQLDIKLSPFRFKFTIKKKQSLDHNFLWLADRIVIIVALAGCLIRIGNFMNSEIYGKPTDSNFSVIFVRDTVNRIMSNGNFIEKISVIPNDVDVQHSGIYRPITLQIKFKRGATEEDYLKYFLERKVKSILSRGPYTTKENIHELEHTPLEYTLTKANGTFVANVHTLGVARHPSQLYESFTCILVLLILLGIWGRKKEKTRHGSLIGLFLILVFTMRIFHEMLKEGEIVCSTKWGVITDGQALSIPVVIIGLIFYFWTFKEKRKT